MAFRLPAPQIGSAQAASRTAPASADQLLVASGTLHSQDPGGRPGVCGKERPGGRPFRFKGRGAASPFRPMLIKLPCASSGPSWDNSPSAHPFKIRRPWGSAAFPHSSCASSTSRAPSVAWTATSPRGPHGAKPHRLFLPPARARYGPHLACQPPSPADAAPCGSAVLAPSGGEARVPCHLPSSQIGSAQAARPTAPARARSSPRRPRHRPDPRGRSGRPGACGRSRPSVVQGAHPGSAPARPPDVFRLPAAVPLAMQTPCAGVLAPFGR
jgi:hypothetical protein